MQIYNLVYFAQVTANCSCGYKGAVYYDDSFPAAKPKCPNCGRTLSPWSGTPEM